MKLGECAAMLAIAGKVYGREIRPDLVEAWQQFMGDISPDEGAAAMRGHIAESHHFPAVSDIRRRVTEMRIAAPDIAAAWGEVQRAVNRVGYYRVPEWSHKAIEAAVETIGWQTICHTLQEDLPTLRAQFERYYKARVDSASRGANSSALEAHRHGKPVAAKDVIKLLLAHRDDDV